MDSITQRLQSAAHADLSTTLLTAAVVGLVSHLPIHSFEFERIALQFVVGCVACFFGLGGLYVYTGQCGSFYAALARSLLVQAVFHLSLLVSIAVYRLGFHRCRHIPGPVGAKLSRFYAMYLASKKVQFHNELWQMHENYGNFVRTAFATYVPRIKHHADLLAKRLRERSGRPVDTTQWVNFFGFDMIGDVGYGKSFDQLVTLKEHPAVRPIHEHLAEFGVIQNVPWLLHLLDCIPGAAESFAATERFCQDQRRRKQEMFRDDEHPSDIVSLLLKAMSEKDGTGPPSIEALDGDTRLLLVAGSDTAFAALTNALFFLARHPEKQDKLRAALLLGCSDTASSTGWSYDAILGVKYLEHFINETLRLKPSVLISGRFETPLEGIQVDEVHIPGKVVVTTPIVWLQRDPRYWQRADEFLPERWGDDRRAEMGTDSAPYFPFSLGAFSCPGKNLSLMVLRIVLSAIVQNFQVGFAPGETGVEFDNEVKDTFTTILRPLYMQFTQLGDE